MAGILKIDRCYKITEESGLNLRGIDTVSRETTVKILSSLRRKFLSFRVDSFYRRGLVCR